VNVQDDPVLVLGPTSADDLQMAPNQVLAYQGRYYLYYSGLGHRPEWSVCLAVSDDLIHWQKWTGNPVLPYANNETSGYLVFDGERFRLYTVNSQLRVHLPR
jgi:sucrose-6-phosphate hydrolase SacC (GH32 family)